MRRATLAAILLGAGAVVIARAVLHAPVFGVSDVAHESVRFHLGLTGSSIYEYHALSGRWPAQNGDLALTSLPAVSPHWRYLLDEEMIVVVWHKNLENNPNDNAKHILAYYNKGLISQGGRSWVCWGDLRTEYIKTEDLRSYLDKLKK